MVSVCATSRAPAGAIRHLFDAALDTIATRLEVKVAASALGTVGEVWAPSPSYQRRRPRVPQHLKVQGTRGLPTWGE
ncbi:hypothetical protein PSCLAVI8L_20031 [Pseudoclavibacter sp. 8L]|nr:hypothetical protein PSCLAVI8L_20031 [Pseudoclavibacter sp. 8L]